MSIEEIIKERWDYPNADKLDWNNAKDDIDKLLSSLEVANKEIGKLGGSLAGLGSDLDVQKKWVDELESYFRLEVNRLTDELAKEKERARLIQEHADKLGGIISGQTDERLELEMEIEVLTEKLNNQIDSTKEWTERALQAEAQLASIKADESIGKLEIEVVDEELNE